jgi:hypothetical protein
VLVRRWCGVRPAEEESGLEAARWRGGVRTASWTGCAARSRGRGCMQSAVRNFAVIDRVSKWVGADRAAS